MTESFDPVDIGTLEAPPQEGIFEVLPEDVAAPPPPYHSPFSVMQHTWYGTDGSVWNLDDPSKGVFIVQESLEGLHYPLMDEVNRESPAVAGSKFYGYRVKARDVVWAVYVYSDESSEHFYDLDRRFFDSMKIGKYGKWRVTRPDGQYRELSMRQVPVQFSHDRDPGMFGWVKYAVRFIADENPFWTYPVEVAGSKSTFASEEELNFFGGPDGVGPNFYISPSRAEVSKDVYNDGDEDVWGIYTITGPMDFVDWTVGKRKYHIDCDLLVGETLTIDTRPHKFKIYDSKGANRISSIDNWTFDPFPTKGTVKVEMFPQGLGGGSVVIDTSPLYHRAW